MDESGSMSANPLSPAMREALSKIWAEVGAEGGLKEIPWKLKNFEKKVINYEEPVFHNKIMIDDRPFEKEILSKKFNSEIPRFMNTINALEKEFPDIFAEIKLSPAERAERARERGEALAEACHAGTPGVTAVMRPLSLKRGFCSISTY